MRKCSKECPYYYQEIDDCIYGEDGVPDNLIKMCSDLGYIKPRKFIMILNAANYVSGYEFDDGLNDVSNLLKPNGQQYNCRFYDIEDVFAHMHEGPCFREVTFPDQSAIIMQDLKGVVTHSNKVVLGPVQMWSPKSVQYLIDNGADISINQYSIVKWALFYNFPIFYYLQEYISNKDENLWLKIIKYLEREHYLG